MTDSNTPAGIGEDEPNLGKDGTIPNSDDGIALGHDPDGSNFNPEEDVEVTAQEVAEAEPGATADEAEEEAR